MIIATDRRQARNIFRFIRGLLTDVPMLRRMIRRETSEAFELENDVVIEVGTASFRSVRGYTIVAALCDEIARWPTDDAAEPDYEILNALRPGMVTIPNAMLLCASSPWGRRGAMWDAYRKHFGREGSILVWQAATWRSIRPCQSALSMRRWSPTRRGRLPSFSRSSAATSRASSHSKS